MQYIHDILTAAQRASKTMLAMACCVMMMLFAACSGDSSFNDEPAFSGEVWISMRISNQGAITSRSRAAEDTQGHPDEESTAYENYVDPNDLGIILFDGRGQAVKTLTSKDFIVTAIDSRNSGYTLSARIDENFFDEIGLDAPMSIMAVANATGTAAADPLGIGGSFPYPDAKETYRSLSLKLNTYSYNPAGIWMPDGAGNRIPMSGLLHTKSPSAADLEASTSLVTAYDVTSDKPLELQRAMVKIRILDAISALTTATSTAYIKSVTLYGGNTRGAYMPLQTLSPLWFTQGTSVVERSAKPAVTNAWADPSAQLSFMKLDYQFTYGTQGYDQFICYAPEQHSNSDDPQNTISPYLRIVVCEGDAKNTETVYDKIMIKDCLNATYNDMARNHIYQFTVTRAEKSQIRVDFMVCPWSQMTSGDIIFN